jgi:epoxyqueuosine reductase
MRVLMHMCCAKCSEFPFSVLREKGIEVDGLYYKKGIHDSIDYKEHVENIKAFSKRKNFNLYFYPEIDHTCEAEDVICIEELRIKMTFELGKELHYDAISSTMLSSPSMNHERIVEFGLKYSKLFNMPFLYEDLMIENQIK